MVQLVLGFGRKHRKNILGFCIGASVLLYPPIFSVSAQTPFSFAKSITWKPSPPTSTIPFSSLHSSLLPTSTLSLFSFLHLQEKTKRSYYSLDILQRYCFQLYKLCPCHAARAWTAGIWAPASSVTQRKIVPWLKNHGMCSGTENSFVTPSNTFHLYVILVCCFNLHHI